LLAWIRGLAGQVKRYVTPVSRAVSAAIMSSGSAHWGVGETLIENGICAGGAQGRRWDGADGGGFGQGG